MSKTDKKKSPNDDKKMKKKDLFVAVFPKIILYITIFLKHFFEGNVKKILIESTSDF